MDVLKEIEETQLNEIGTLEINVRLFSITERKHFIRNAVPTTPRLLASEADIILLS